MNMHFPLEQRAQLKKQNVGGSKGWSLERNASNGTIVWVSSLLIWASHSEQNEKASLCVISACSCSITFM